MISFFIVKNRLVHAAIASGIMVLVIIFYIYFNTEYLFDIFTLNDLVKEFEHPDIKI